jgi:hypothetical protein
MESIIIVALAGATLAVVAVAVAWCVAGLWEYLCERFSR